MSKRLYVGNLPFSVTSERLKEIFSAYGNVEEAIVVVFKNSGKSKGFGFVTIADDVQGEKAKQEMNGKEVEGRKLFVNEAKPFDPNAPREPRRRFGGQRSFGRRRDDDEESNVKEESEEQEDSGEDSEE